MLEALIVLFVILWALGFLGGIVTTSLIHLLLVVALVMVIVRLASGRRLV